MKEYNFFADILDTFQSSSEWIQALFIIIPPSFILILTGMFMRFFLMKKRSEITVKKDLIYTENNNEDYFKIYRNKLHNEENSKALFLDDSISRQTKYQKSTD